MLWGYFTSLQGSDRKVIPVSEVYDLLNKIHDTYQYTYQAFYNQRHHCSSIIKSEQRQYFMEKITENWYNYKEIFRLTNKLLGKDIELPLPPTEDLSVLANEFNTFFMSKIRRIMQD